MGSADSAEAPLADPAVVPLAGWGRVPVERCRLQRPASRDELTAALAGSRSAVPRGLGRSYGDASLNRGGDVLLQTRFDRFIDFDAGSGTLTCEAGVSLADIIRVFLPRGWFLPTTPGTKHVTVGGAIAADVHGKNHHVDGSFGAYVESIELLLPSQEIVRCGPSAHAELFDATVGGMGLTGVILSARIRLQPIASSYFRVEHRKTRDLEETLQTFEATNHDHRYSVAWVDGLARGRQLGRAVVMLANDTSAPDLPPWLRSDPLAPRPRDPVRLPFEVPGFVMNAWTVGAFNELYYRTRPNGARWVDYESFFYPLDGIGDWNRIYGRRGFVQYQAHFPPDTAAEGLRAVLETAARSRRASFLAVLKACGPKGRGLLSYLSEGYTLALDFPNSGEDLRGFTEELDQILLRRQGRLYLAKDALMSAETFQAMYPEAEAFRAVKARVDPEARLSSSLARRVGLVPA